MGLIRELKKIAVELENSSQSSNSRRLQDLLHQLIPYEKDIQRMIKQKWEDDIRLDVGSAFDIAPKYVTKEIAKKYEEAFDSVDINSQIADMILKGYFGVALDSLLSGHEKMGALKVDFQCRGTGKPSHRWWLTVTDLTPEQQDLAVRAAEGDTPDFDNILLPKIFEQLPERAVREFKNSAEGGMIDIYFENGILEINNA